MQSCRLRFETASENVAAAVIDWIAPFAWWLCGILLVATERRLVAVAVRLGFNKFKAPGTQGDLGFRKELTFGRASSRITGGS